MDYLILIASDEMAIPAQGTAEFDAWMAPWAQYNQVLNDGGHLIAAGGLQTTATATTLRHSGGSTQTLDGPFAETKEQIGGFYVIQAADLDQALQLADQVPLAECSLEVRPLSYRPPVS